MLRLDNPKHGVTHWVAVGFWPDPKSGLGQNFHHPLGVAPRVDFEPNELPAKKHFDIAIEATAIPNNNEPDWRGSQQYRDCGGLY